MGHFPCKLGLCSKMNQTPKGLMMKKSSMFKFGSDFKAESTSLKLLAFGAIILLMINAVLFFAFRHVTAVVVLISSLLVIVGAVVAVGFLFVKYRQEPVVRNKLEIEEDKREVQKKINEYQRKVNQTIANRKRITTEKDRELNLRKKAHMDLLRSLESQIERSHLKEESALQSELKKIQRQYFQDGMRSTLIVDSNVPGVGKGLAKRLAAEGIRSAKDVNYEKVLKVSGFGETKAKQVAAWRRNVESELRRTSPRSLPFQTENQIRDRYQYLRTDLGDKIQKEEDSYPPDVTEIKERAKKEHQRNDADQEEYQKRLESYQEDKNRVLHKLADYAEITFWLFLKQANLAEPQSWARLKLPAVVIPAAITLGLVGSAAASLGSAAVIIADSYTATPSMTPTLTSTPTATFTDTPTITLTSTNTATPTKTYTPTITDTSTITFTPSMTPTATLTQTPTATLPAAVEEYGCLPDDTLRQVGTYQSVIDGNTIKVKIDGETYSVHYIGVNVPAEGDYFWSESRSANYQRVAWQTLILIKDEYYQDQGKHIFRYVISQDKFINYELVQEGFGRFDLDLKDLSCYAALLQANGYARRELAGLWLPTPTPYPTAPYVPPTADRSDCDPRYPSVCIRYSSTDLDCSDIPFYNFYVGDSTDPHGFDGNDDGWACER